MRGHNLVSIGLIVIITLLLGWASQRVVLTADWTWGNRASLTTASQRVLKTLDQGPIQFTAFVYPGAARDRVRAKLGRYLRASDDITLTFVDPAKHPAQMRRLGINQSGVVRVTYEGRAQMLKRLREPVVSRALQRLSVTRDQWIVFVRGHGERSLTATGPGGYSQLAAALDAQGLITREISLAQTAAVPDNTAVLVLASPQTKLLAGEIDMIRAYVAQGGNLLWLDDPGAGTRSDQLAAALGIHWLDGTLIYPDYRQLGTGHPAMALVSNYPDSPITNRINRLTLFPFAGAVTVRGDSDWQAQTLLRSATRSWLESDKLQRGTLTFQPDQGDRRGPLPFGVALTRDLPSADDGQARQRHAQRVVVIADSDFISNEFISTLGNHKLGMALFQWLAHRDAQIGIELTGAPDASLQLAPATTRSLWYIFVILLPMTLLGIGIGRWASRRRR